jgi:hypothetical protein
MPSNVNLTYRAFLGYNTYYYCVATVLCLKGRKGGEEGRISTEINEEHPSKLLRCETHGRVCGGIRRQLVAEREIQCGWESLVAT